jgi:hypothetical protein
LLSAHPNTQLVVRRRSRRYLAQTPTVRITNYHLILFSDCSYFQLCCLVRRISSCFPRKSVASLRSLQLTAHIRSPSFTLRATRKRSTTR